MLCCTPSHARAPFEGARAKRQHQQRREQERQKHTREKQQRGKQEREKQQKQRHQQEKRERAKHQSRKQARGQHTLLITVTPSPSIPCGGVFRFALVVALVCFALMLGRLDRKNAPQGAVAASTPFCVEA